MILVADENIDGSIILRLRGDGHEVLAVSEMEPGIADEIVLALANRRMALLVTEDKDFGELVFRQRLVHAGVVLMRLPGLPAAEKGELLSHMLDIHAREVIGSFSVLSRGAFRIRRRGF